MAAVHARVLNTALEILGCDERLAVALGASAADVRRWREGEEDPPLQVFLDALDIVAAGKR